MPTSTRRTALASVVTITVTLLLLFGTSLSAGASGIYTSGTLGYDISYPQKSGPYPSRYAFGIVGVTGGRPFTTNSYFQAEYGWVISTTPTPPSVYINLAYPVGSTASQGRTGPAGMCAPSDKPCLSYNYGYNAAVYAYNAFVTAITQLNTTVMANTWWLDIETANSWSANTSYNVQVIKGARDYLQGQGLTVGLYSTPAMWKKIAGNYVFKLPIWVAGATSADSAGCAQAAKTAFNGGPVWLVQYWNSAVQLDQDYACP